MKCHVVRRHQYDQDGVYLDTNVRLSAAWSPSDSCTQSSRRCFCRSVRSRRCEAHIRRYLWGDRWGYPYSTSSGPSAQTGYLNLLQQRANPLMWVEAVCELAIWPLHVFPSGCSVKPTGQLQRTPVDVSLQVQSHPPLFTAQVSEITARKENVHELPAFFGKNAMLSINGRPAILITTPPLSHGQHNLTHKICSIILLFIPLIWIRLL